MESASDSKLKVSITINIYIDTHTQASTTFDHPTDLLTFSTTNTFARTLDSISKLKIPSEIDLDLLTIAIAANNDTTHDTQIRKEVTEIIKKYPSIKHFLFLNSDILPSPSSPSSSPEPEPKTEPITETEAETEREREKALKIKELKKLFLNTSGYCEIRNVGFIMAYYNNTDVLIQIDDDELMREHYLLRLMYVLDNYKEIGVLSGFYEENGSVLYDEEKDYVSWRKDFAMNQDRRIILSNEGEPLNLLYGMGGNMVCRKEFFQRICYMQALPRGEDFGVLLSAWLVYLHGNSLCDIQSRNPFFRSFATSDEQMTIIHKQPYSEKKDREKYIKLNFIRFMMERNFCQGNVDLDEYQALSYYMYNMTMLDNFVTKMEEVYEEAVERNECRKEVKDEHLAELKTFYEEIQSRNLFEEYKKYQKNYIDFLKLVKIDISQFQVDF